MWGEAGEVSGSNIDCVEERKGFDVGRQMSAPLCIDLFCGLGGWTEGFLAEGYRVVGFDVEIRPYPAQLVIQDVLTIHGSQFRDATVIVASPPCQKYSWLAMPWSRSKSTAKNLEPAKALRKKWETEGPDNRLFDACFRIQREAIEAQNCDCGHPESSHDHDYLNRLDDDCRECSCTRIVKRYIPLIVENVRGAQEWVGESVHSFGSFHLWGDIPALMPKLRAVKVPTEEGGRRTDVGKGSGFTSRDCGAEGKKQAGAKSDWFSKDARAASASAIYGSKSPERKLIAAQIAKIPLPLAQHIAAVYHPRTLPQGVTAVAPPQAETSNPNGLMV